MPALLGPEDVSDDNEIPWDATSEDRWCHRWVESQRAGSLLFAARPALLPTDYTLCSGWLDHNRTLL